MYRLVVWVFRLCGLWLLCFGFGLLVLIRLAGLGLCLDLIAAAGCVSGLVMLFNCWCISLVAWCNSVFLCPVGLESWW